MRKGLLLLIVLLMFTLLGCETNNKEFVFSKDYANKEYSKEVVATNVPEEFRIFTESYYIEDFVVTEDYYFLSYVEKNELDEDVRRIAAYDSEFMLKWDNVYESKYYLEITHSNNDGIILYIYDDNNMFLNNYLLISNEGETVDSIYSRGRMRVHNEKAYFIIFEEITNSSKLVTLKSMELVPLLDIVGNNPDVHYCDESIIVTQMNEDEEIVVDIINFEGEKLYNKEYENGEDIYKLYNGFLVDDEKSSLIEVRDSFGNLFWKVKDLQGSIKGLKIIDGNLTLVEGDQVLTISSTGVVLSRENEEIVVHNANMKEYYQDFELRRKYTVNESIVLKQVIVPHEIQISGLHRVFFFKDDVEKLMLGGETSLISVQHVDDKYVYLYEEGLSFDNLPNIAKLYLVNFEGEVDFVYNVISNTFDIDNNDYFYYFDGNMIIKSYLPTYLSDSYRN